MPGILPMKVIRVGSSAQSRIAQACDRCRSKKIRCDGVRPCCTQCANVGFECKTSDKLSRRAFPRGYTESLEDRVRGLEAEVRELKQLLDEKDEKIDMLSRIHSFSPVPRKSAASASPAASQDVKATASPAAEESLEIVPPSTDSSVAPAGTSSASSFIESFKAKIAASRKTCPTIKSGELRSVVRPASSGSSPKTVSRAPPRLLSDQYVNIFLQEWAPLFPIISRASFLKFYQEFLVEPESPKWQNRKHSVAQLYLVFDIAALSSKSTNKQNITSYEQEWRRAMQGIPSTASLATLQCHLLAQILYLLKEDQKHFLRHRACGITMCHQLGLHLAQERLSISLLEKETRKRIFWAQYIVDRFGSSTCGVPMLLRDGDISTEEPADVDDEHITASGFLPATSEETKMSNALALIRVSRILSKVVETLHRPAAYYTIPISKFNALTEELDQWMSKLPSHLRLKFANDKPSTGIVSDRSPLLSLAEFYIRLLINRPLMAFATGNAASAAVLASADAAKHIGQLLDLLDERSMNYVFPLSRGNMLLTAGFSLLWHSLDLPSGSRLVKDNHKSLALISRMLHKESDSAAAEFVRIMNSLLSIPTSMSPPTQASTPSLRALHPMPAPDTPKQKGSTREQLRAIAARLANSSFGSNKSKSGETTPQASVAYIPPSRPQFAQNQRNASRVSVASAQTEPGFPTLSPVTSHESTASRHGVNLDFFSLGNESAMTLPNMSMKDSSNTSAWEQMLANIDSGDSNIYHGIYGGFTLPEAFPADGPLDISDIDPSVLTSTFPTAAAVTTALPPQNGNNLYFDASGINIWSSHDSFPSDTASSNTLVSLHDIQRAVGQGTVPPQSVLSYNSEEDSVPSSGSGEDYGSSAMSNSVYSDRGSNIGRKATSVSSMASGSGSGHPFEVGSIDGAASTTADLNNESPYGGILIPNEYGIGF